MSPTAYKQPLEDFFKGATCRTGETWELVALAELSGYTVEHAQREGWSSLFEAARQSRDSVLREDYVPAGSEAGQIKKALGRGLTYSTPILALWALFPPDATRLELLYLAFLIVVSWGGSLASNYSLGLRMLVNERSAWIRAGVVAVLAVGASVALGWALSASGSVRPGIATVGSLQVAFFFGASPLLMRGRLGLLPVLSLSGALAGILSLALRGSSLPLAQEGEVLLRAVAAASLLFPALLLGRWVIHCLSSDDPGGGPTRAAHSDVATFGLYGVTSAVLVLWVPLATSDTRASILFGVVVAALALAEVTVVRARMRASSLLTSPFDPRAFSSVARRILLSAIAVYLLPVVLGVEMVILIVGEPSEILPMGVAGLAVVALGSSQVLSLIGQSLNGVRKVVVLHCFAALALLAGGAAIEGSLQRYELYLAVMSALALALSALVLRLGSRPVNYL